jgi:hypothetical protein
LADPLVKFSVIRALGIRLLTSLENKLHSLMYWSIEVALQSEVVGIGAPVVLNTKLLNLLGVWIEDIFAQLATRVRQWNVLDLSVNTIISQVVSDVETLLPKNDLSIVRVVILLCGVKITEHKGKGDILV